MPDQFSAHGPDLLIEGELRSKNKLRKMIVIGIERGWSRHEAREKPWAHGFVVKGHRWADLWLSVKLGAHCITPS